ncbi:hypothetical protein BHE74_00052847 [Ensete ventricosum]|nr:hypothetical protein BHE74_00052847 [Ensete ventricosum]RZS10290.1 hypothetical protein BHM03_00041480 [Ensete ventricosum]
MHCIPRSLAKHSYINSKSPIFGYLDEKSANTDLLKFSGSVLQPCLGTWSLPLHSLPFRPRPRSTLSLYESKGSMTPRKSRLCDTIALPSP